MNRNKLLATILLGVFMGALDSGIVAPARRVIEQNLGVDPSLGIWIVTMYTLIYAVSMPLIGKISDIYGRGRLFKVSVFLFTLGSAGAGLSNYFGGFTLLLVSRGVQALGGGGIMPIASAEIASLFPPEKRGTALGMQGAVFGIASILGPTIGSSILDIAGTSDWGWLFLINIPIGLAILIVSHGFNTLKTERRKPLDLSGAVIIAACVFSFMFGLTNLSLKDLSTFLHTDVWPWLAVGIMLIPLISYVENRSIDPIINISYFRDRRILLALLISVFTGICLMGIIFVPQWAENLLKITSGKGGYIVTALSIFSGIAAPLGGRFLDKFGAKRVILAGFAFIVSGCLLAGYWATYLWQILIALALMGFGIGFTMGTPLNYLILALVPDEESGSALAVLSLFRSIGTTLGPSLMAGFLAEAGQNLMPALKDRVEVFKMMPSGVGGGTAPKGMELLQTADVTNIVDRLTKFIDGFDKIPSMIKPLIAQQIKSQGHLIQDVYQSVLNEGFKDIHTTTAVLAAVGLVLTLALPAKQLIKSGKSGGTEND